MQKSRPCRICRRWFVPDLRIGARQRACSKPECQRRRRSATQASWRERNPDYRAARRIEACRKQACPEVPKVSRPLEGLPWDVAQDDLTAPGTVFLAELAEKVLRHLKTEIAAQVRARVEEIRRHALVDAKDEIGP